MQLPSRTFNNSDYRYGFNGKEKEEAGSFDYDFGARVYDSRVARFLSLDPKIREYPYWSPYNYTGANNPILFIDLDGEGPGDVVVALSGADLFSDGDVATAGDVANNVLKNSPGTSAKAFSSTYWKTESHWTPYGGRAVTIRQDTDFDKITQEAYDYIIDNKTDDGEVVIYGYSHGGVLANHLAKRLEKAGVKVDLLVTVDAAAGPKSDEVDREISANVSKNTNYYQSTASGIGSKGGENSAEDSEKTKVENNDLTAKDVNHGNIDEKTKDSAVDNIVKTIDKAEEPTK